METRTEGGDRAGKRSEQDLGRPGRIAGVGAEKQTSMRTHGPRKLLDHY